MRWLLVLLLLPNLAFAAKVPIHWVNPTLNEDGTALTDLAKIVIQWGPCSADGLSLASITQALSIPAPATSTSVTTTGLTKICFIAFAVNAAGQMSSASNVTSKTVTNVGKPIQLGKPVVLP